MSQWKKRGYQDWLLGQNWLAQTRSRQEPATDLAADFDATQLNHAALQLGALQIFEALRALAPGPTPLSASSEPSQNKPVGPETSQTGSSLPPTEEAALATASSPSDAQSDNSSIPSCSFPPSHQTENNPKPKNQTQKSLLDLRLGGDSAAFVRLINALARASRETMLVQKYRDACEKAKAALKPMLDPNRKLTESEDRAIVDRLDRILGFK